MLTLIELLKKVSLFSNLNSDQLRLIADSCQRKLVRANRVLFKENELGAQFYIVISGSIKIYTSKSGEDKILSIFKSGDSFGELSLLDGKPRSASAATLEDSMLLVLEKEDFMNVLRQNFDISILIMQELCQRLRDTNQHVHDLTFLDSRTRVLKHLIQMANKHGRREGTTISLRIMLNFDELARMAGVEKQVLMQVIQEFEAKGLLYVTDEGFSLDLSKLRQ